MFIRRYIWMLLSLCLLTGCSFRSLHETLSVVGEADSLWQQGQMYDDSVRLAQAYSTLRVWRTFYADEYAHACYHYGKLLRAHDDPVSAMQVFIDATHSRTRDYHILGRVYSNMGDICHCAGDYALSYNMFEHSANIFLRDDDTLSYYYCLNDMAFELAVQAKKDSCVSILRRINNKYDQGISLAAYTIFTYAEVCLQCSQYDSAIYYINELYDIKELYSQGLSIKAQSFSYLHIQDSATYYANLVLTRSNSISDIHNALYILTNDDSTKNIEGVRQMAADRADIQIKLKIRQGKLSQAVQLLEQDLHRKPNLAWLYAIFITLIIIGSVLFSYVMIKRKRHQLLSQQISDLEIKNRETIEQKRTQIEAYCIRFSKSKDIKTDLCWSDYEKMCDIINQYFYLLAKKLQLDYNMSEREVRVCVLSLFDYGYERMADLLFYAPNGIGKLKVRVARKVGTTAKNLRHFLIEKAINT